MDGKELWGILASWNYPAALGFNERDMAGAAKEITTKIERARDKVIAAALRPETPR